MKKRIIGWGIAVGLVAALLTVMWSEKPAPESGNTALQPASAVAEQPRKAMELPGKVAEEKVCDRFMAKTDQREVLGERKEMLPDGTIKRTRLLKTSGKYPYRRVVERIVKDDKAKKFVPRVIGEMVADQVLVRLHDDASVEALDELNRQFGATVSRVLSDGKTVVVKLAAPTLDAVQEAIDFYSQAAAAVAYAEPDYIRHPTNTPNDTQYGELWGMTRIEAPEAWDISTGNAATIVAVIDTGMDMDHPDLTPNLWVNENETAGDGQDNDGNGYIDDVNGWNFVAASASPEDDDGHGTHCAGTVAAAGNNASQVVGVCWGASLMPIRAGSGAGFADSDIVDAIRYAARNGAKVISNSYGGSGYSQTIYDAIDYAYLCDAIFVAAAGNDGTDNDLLPIYPASYELPNVISVAASDSSDDMASFSNYGVTSVDLAAPGVGIVSTYLAGETSSLSGTSMACPHVAGALTLYAGIDPDVTPEEAKQLLLQSVDEVADLVGQVVSGGRLNVSRLMAEGSDSDGDGMPDFWEERYGFPIDDASDGGTNDFDGDFLTNVEEFQNGCNPTNADTDADSLVDGWEIRYGFNALNTHAALPRLQYLGASTYATEAYGLAVSSNYVFVADGANGLRVFDVSTPSVPQLLATVATEGEARGVALAGDYAYVADSVTGLHAVDVSNPEQPALAGSVEMTALNCAVQGSYVYVAAGEDDLQVVSVVDPANPSIVGEWGSIYRTVYDVAVADGYVFLGMDGYVGRLSIANPAAPSDYAGNAVYEDSGKSDVGSIFHNGSDLFLGQNDYGFSVFNSGLSMVSRTAGEGAASGIYEHDDLIFLADGANGLVVLDGADVTAVSAYDSYENIYARDVVVTDGYAFVAGETTGLHVFQVSADLDGDGLYDTWERAYFGSTDQSWTNDYDGDGINNWGEYLADLNPTNSDQDADGLIDGWDEVQIYNTDPRTADTDGDGLGDYDEVMTYGTDPYLSDTDDDGLSDYDEVMLYSSDPNESDADGDGMPEGWELEHGLNTSTNDAAGQLDDDNGDGLINDDDLSNYEEYLLGTDPNNGDTDGDGVNDKDELELGTNPSNAGDPLWVDDDAPLDKPVSQGGAGGKAYDPEQSDPDEDGTAEHPFDSIQEAINVASNGVKILVQPGWYDGGLNRGIDTGGKKIEIVGIEGATNTFVYGDGLASCFVFRSGETTNTIIRGLTITTGISSCDDGDCGNQHGILCQDVSNPLIADCIITNNELSGIECQFGSSPVIQHCDISMSGTGVNCSDGSAPQIIDSRIHDVYYGVASVSSYGLSIEGSTIDECWSRGIWVKNDIALSITDSLISTNMGGLRLENCLAELDRCRLLGNIAPDYYEVDGVTYFSSANQALDAANADGKEDVVNDNENGAGILLLSGSVLYAQNTLIAGNQAVALDPDYPENAAWPNYGLGGGIYVGEDCWVSNMNCTVADNSARRGGGISSRGSHADVLRNMILWGNSAEDQWVSEVTIYHTNLIFVGISGGLSNFVEQIESEIVNVFDSQSQSSYSSLHCRSGDGFDVEYCDVENGGDYIHPRKHTISQNPQFVGGTDYHLPTNSPCLDIGTEIFAPAYDLDGVPRPLDGDADTNNYHTVDLGAYELLNPLADSDRDGIPDQTEVDDGTDPSDPESRLSAALAEFLQMFGLDSSGSLDSSSLLDSDSDFDGLSNLQEYLADTNPVSEDTDGDKSLDGDEAIAGTDPLDAASYFYVSDIRPLADGGCEVVFDTVAGRTYTVYCSSSLGGEWTLLLDGIAGGRGGSGELRQLFL